MATPVFSLLWFARRHDPVQNVFQLGPKPSVGILGHHDHVIGDPNWGDHTFGNDFIACCKYQKWKI
jgi:hypothetical protein